MSYELAYSPQDYEGNPLFEIRDDKDYMVLHTAIIADVDILVTGDKDFTDVEIVDCQVKFYYKSTSKLSNLKNIK